VPPSLPDLVGEFKRDYPRIDLDNSLPAARVITALKQLAGKRAPPRNLVVDHDTEFAPRALDDARAPTPRLTGKSSLAYHERR
jgi:hypothetical protein